MTISSGEIKRNMTILLNGEVYQILEWQHRQAPKAPPTLTLKLKQIPSGNVYEKKLQGNQKLTVASTESKTCQYLYRDGDFCNFMDLETFETYEVLVEVVGESIRFIAEGSEVHLLFYKENPLMVEIANNITLKVTEAEQAVKGNTQSVTTKKATLETGLKVNVPLFINVGDKVSVNTETGEYIARI